MSSRSHCPAFFQRLIPQHALSRFAGWVAHCQFPPLKNYLIKWFIKRYGVDMQEATEVNPLNYPDFQSFFIRTLKEEVRPIASGQNEFISPVDGIINQLGAIQSGRIFQAKGFNFDLTELLGGKKEVAKLNEHPLCKKLVPHSLREGSRVARGDFLFEGGQFATLYLAPKDYHHVHMPLTGKLVSMTYIPGRLFSVNPKTVEQVPNLFSRNERVVCLFETAAGPMAMILVGAMIVASIHTAWASQVTPLRAKHIQSWRYSSDELTFTKGQEMGYFKLGSMVILLFGQDHITWQNGLYTGDRIKMGEVLGTII